MSDVTWAARVILRNQYAAEVEQHAERVAAMRDRVLDGLNIIHASDVTGTMTTTGETSSITYGIPGSTVTPTIADVCITCAACGAYHSIFTGCVMNKSNVPGIGGTPDDCTSEQ